MMIKVKQYELYDYYKNSRKSNCITRQLQKDCYELYKFNKKKEDKKKYRFKSGEYMICYGCNKVVNNNHPNYVFSCMKCGSLFQKNRKLQINLSDQVILVIGARTKLGHQIVIKLLNAGATVIGTTRYPQKAIKLFEGYKDLDYPEISRWNLHFYEKPLDLDTDNLDKKSQQLRNYIEQTFGQLNSLIFCAAQTIRAREKTVNNTNSDDTNSNDTNRYRDPRFVNEKYINSWQMKLEDITQTEFQEVLRVNTIAPTIFIQQLVPLMKKSKYLPYIINVHAREGLFTVKKNGTHIHTNIAKAGLAMLTKSLIESKLRTYNNKCFSIHGCDPGWISVDEYYENKRPWIVPPLDEIDGAARILYPIFNKILHSDGRTRRHFNELRI